MSTKPTHFAVLRVLILAAVMLIGGSSTAFACPVCFGAEETP